MITECDLKSAATVYSFALKMLPFAHFAIPRGVRFMKKVLLSLLFLCATPVFADDYQIIVDAGSSGSRLHLFEYSSKKPVPVIKDIYSDNTKPGLSSYEKNPQDAGASLQKLLDGAMQKITEKKVRPQDVKISVLATAGMRLLPEEKQKAIYENVTAYLKQNYAFDVNRVETISGKLEGLYGWLDVNYLYQNFQNRKPTIGSIDMGGASTQIAFAADYSKKPEDSFKLTIGGQQYTVFSKSFLGMGQDQARLAMNNYPEALYCYPAGYPLTQTIIGNFNFKNCDAVYADFISKKQVVEQIVSTKNNTFVAYSGAYHAYEFFYSDKAPDQGRMETNIQATCAKTWDKLKEEYKDIPEKFLSGNCANGTYMSNLFHKTYELRGKQLIIANKIKDQDIDWTLGALLHSLIESGGTPLAPN